MTTGLILIVAILVLGGVIATVGDRLGTKVGKARLSLFRLRPRNTAVVVTIMTGSIISASTLAILFAADARLRIGVFQLEQIQRNLRHKQGELAQARRQLNITTTQKIQAEKELAQARKQLSVTANQKIQAEKELAQARQQLQSTTNQKIQVERELAQARAEKKAEQIEAQRRQAATQAQLNQTQVELAQTQSQLHQVSQQKQALHAEIAKLQNERQQLIEQRNQIKAMIGERDLEIAHLDLTVQQRDRDIAWRQTRLKDLEKQQEYLESQVAKLGQYYQSYKILRQGNVALPKGQVLAAAVVRVVGKQAVHQVITALLKEANQTAIALTQPGTNQTNQQVVEISPEQLVELANQLNDGRSYVVRIMSAGNYLLGEKHVQVMATTALNQVVFYTGDVIAGTSVTPANMTTEEIQQRLNLLLFATKFRARSLGIIVDAIDLDDNNRLETLFHFIEQIKQYNQPVDIKAVATQDIYTAGPLKIELVAVQNGQVIFHT